jgi:uncharacterized protein with PIN domain
MVDTATFRFYADLNDFLPPHLKQRSVSCSIYDGNQSVKHLFESMGIPHTEVDLILADGEPVNFDHIVQPGQNISVYPPFRSLSPAQEGMLRPPLADPVRFLLDNHLGRLARYLRLLGFDALYFNDQLNDEELADLASQTECVLLTRDRGLLKRKQVIYGYCLRSVEPYEQLKSVIFRFNLADKIDPWKRCLRCNGILEPVDKETIIDRLEPKTKRYFTEFRQCRSCEQIYWQGSHHTSLQRFLDQIRSEFSNST